MQVDQLIQLIIFICFLVDFLIDKLNQCLISFSVINNTSKLFRVSNKDTINCLDGFRFISILFIILYHTYTEAQLPSGNFHSNDKFISFTFISFTFISFTFITFMFSKYF